MNPDIEKFYHRKLFRLLKEGPFMKSLKKRFAIREISFQPFYGDVMPKPITGRLKWRRIGD